MYQQLSLSLADPLADIIGEYTTPPALLSNRKDLRLLSLFSGGGGMDIGFEGNFICHRRSAGQSLDSVVLKSRLGQATAHEI